MVDPAVSVATDATYWLDPHVAAWTTLALAYGLTGIYMRAFDRNEYPWWCWGTFFSVGSALFVVINRGHLLAGNSRAGAMLEFVAIGTLALALVVLYKLSKHYVTSRDRREDLEDRIEEYEDEYDIDRDDH